VPQPAGQRRPGSALQPIGEILLQSRCIWRGVKSSIQFMIAVGRPAKGRGCTEIGVESRFSVVRERAATCIFSAETGGAEVAPQPGGTVISDMRVW